MGPPEERGPCAEEPECHGDCARVAWARARMRRAVASRTPRLGTFQFGSLLVLVLVQPLAESVAESQPQYRTATAAAEAHRARFEEAHSAAASPTESYDPRQAPWHLAPHRGARVLASHAVADWQSTPSLHIGPSSGSAELAAASANMGNASMRLGLELKYGNWLVDINFFIAFNATNTSGAYNCIDRAARCLPEELRYMMKDPDSRLFQVLQHGRFAQLLTRCYKTLSYF